MMKLTPLFLAANMLAPIAVRADLATCRTIEQDLDRLACYDLESGRTPIAQDVETADSPWTVRIETSEMTDDTNVFLSVQSDDIVACRWDQEPAILFVRCMENTTSVIISTGCHMTSSRYNDYGDVTYRLDDAPARTKGFTESTNNRSLGLWRGNQAIPFAKEMLGHDEMLVRMTPYGESAVTARFRISGLREAIAPLRAACAW